MINPSKLSFYSEFKNYYKLEKYLTTIKNGHKRQTVTKLRISNHTLRNLTSAVNVTSAIPPGLLQLGEIVRRKLFNS